MLAALRTISAAYGDALYAHKLHGLCRITVFEAEFDDFTASLHQRTQILRLCVTAAQFRHVRAVKSIFVTLNYHQLVEFSSR
jgi:hypothetical protein